MSIYFNDSFTGSGTNNGLSADTTNFGSQTWTDSGAGCTRSGGELSSSSGVSTGFSTYGDGTTEYGNPLTIQMAFTIKTGAVSSSNMFMLVTTVGGRSLNINLSRTSGVWYIGLNYVSTAIGFTPADYTEYSGTITITSGAQTLTFMGKTANATLTHPNSVGFNKIYMGLNGFSLLSLEGRDPVAAGGTLGIDVAAPMPILEMKERVFAPMPTLEMSCTGVMQIPGSVANGRFVAVASGNDSSSLQRIVTSPNGVLWTPHDGDPVYGILQTKAVASNGDIVVTVAKDGITRQVMRSVNGNSWTAQAAPDGTWNDVCYGAGQFVAVGASGTNRVMTSPDGIVWTGRDAAAAYVWNSVVWNGKIYVAVCDHSSGYNKVMTSTDGIVWALQSAPANTNDWGCVIWSNAAGLFVAVARNSVVPNSLVMTSPDGLAWTTRTTSGNTKIAAVECSPTGLFVAIPAPGDATGKMLTSSDGLAWSSAPSSLLPAGKGYSDIAWGNGTFVAVAADVIDPPQIVTSMDGSAWTTRDDGTSDSGMTYRGITWHPNNLEAPSIPVTIDVAAPMAQFALQSGATVNAEAPIARFEGVFFTRPPNSINVAAPMAQMDMRSGATLDATAPMPIADIQGTVKVMVRITGTAPMPTLGMSVTTAGLAKVDVVAPMATFEARAGAVMDCTAPMARVSITATADGLLTIVATAPMAQFEGRMTSGNIISFDLLAPMPMSGPWGTIVAVAPMARAEIVMRSVLVVTYEAYAINMQPGEKTPHQVTRYTGWQFNQIIRHGNTWYGVADDGLYPIGGPTDYRVAPAKVSKINWDWDTASTDFGSRQKKQVRETFMHGRLSGNATARVSVGELPEQTYAALIVAGSNGQAHRVKYGKGLEAQYWSFGMSGNGVGDIDDMQHEPAELTRKL